MNAIKPISVIIPAHNESSVIQRTLRTLLADARAGEFEVWVVCNGCSDDTAAKARALPGVSAVEINEASKVAALNEGMRRANGSTTLLLDADISLDTAAARRLCAATCASGTEVAIGHMDVDCTGASAWVRAFYRVWRQHPYLQRGKFAAAIALSNQALERIGTLPTVTADDTYLQHLFPADKVAVVDSVVFRAYAPRTLGSLLNVRTRSYRGTRELGLTGGQTDRRGATESLSRRVFRNPRLWTSIPAYLLINTVAQLRSRLTNGVRWERDDTARQPLS